MTGGGGIDGLEQGIATATGLTVESLRNRCFGYALDSAKVLVELCRARDIYLTTAATMRATLTEIPDAPHP